MTADIDPAYWAMLRKRLEFTGRPDH
jgi:hypothetical protein